MSKISTRNLQDLKDSRLLYEKTLPPFGYIIITIIWILLIAVIIWSINTSKTYIVKSSGVVESVDKNYIMSSYTGEIKEMYIQEGSYVKDGDVIFSIKSTDLDLQEEQILAQIEVYNEKITQLRKLEKSIVDNENYFNIEIESERQYYNQYEAYMSQLNQNKIDETTYKSYGYNDEQIEAEILKNNAKISEIYYSTLKSVNESIFQYEEEIKKLEIQNNAIANGQTEYHVLASVSGIVHMMSDYKPGMVVQAAGVVGSIATENDEYTVLAYISVTDMPRISTGDKVDVEVLGLSQSLYGTLPGTVISIDNDTSTSQDGEQSYFKAKVSLDNAYLLSTKGNKVNISNGMSVEARIIYDELSYFDYVIETIGIHVR